VKSNEHTVLILDDDPHIRRSLETLLTAYGYRIRSHAEPDDFFRAGPPRGPACLLLDQQLGKGVTGVQVHQKMLEYGWDLPTVFLTAHWDVQLVVDAMREGADGFLAKPFDPAELIKAVERALRGAGDRVHDRQKIIEARGRMASLTERERQIVGMVTSGLLNKEIADQLNLAVVTVKVHRSRAMRKTGAGNPAELARIVTLAAMVD
jgi:FixJ family two-component response regulator